MATADKIYWLHALSPLHVGTGRGEGYIDLPLAREKVTGLPYVPGSSIKGVFADSCKATDEERRKQPVLQAAFGRADNDAANAGALVFTDARLAFLPVRSLYGTFAWCTSPLVLARLRRDLDAAGLADIPPAPIFLEHVLAAHVARENSPLAANGKIHLEDLDFDFKVCEIAKKWAVFLGRHVFPAPTNAANPWQEKFAERMAVLPDDYFNFLCETATEVQAHVRIDSEFKRVATGALWYEESLPAETILGGLVWCDQMRGGNGGQVTRENVLSLCASKDGRDALQIGGKATVGKGRVRLLFHSQSSSDRGGRNS